MKLNKLCNHLANSIQSHCYKGVTTIFQTEFADDYEVTTNSQALEKLLTHLLNDSARFTNKGFIILSCLASGKNIKFAISDTSESPENMSSEDSSVRVSTLNMKICQSISHLLHGCIWRDTAYANGVRYYFEIPQTITNNPSINPTILTDNQC